MGGRRQTNRKRLTESNTKREYPRTRRSIARLLSATEQRTFCGCRGVSGDYPASDTACPLGFPWLCGGVPASEKDSPPPCNTGVSLEGKQ